MVDVGGVKQAVGRTAVEQRCLSLSAGNWCNMFVACGAALQRGCAGTFGWHVRLLIVVCCLWPVCPSWLLAVSYACQLRL
jgi:hypothetical protein